MEQNNNLLKVIENLSEAEKLELFKVEELEVRLEMAAVAKPSKGTSTTVKANGACNNTVAVNGACW